MAKGVHGKDFLLAVPGREGPDRCRGFGVGEVWFVFKVEIVAGDGEGVVDGVGAAMGADGISSSNRVVVTTDDDGTSFGIVFLTPFQWNWIDAGLTWVGGEDDAGNGRG